MAHLPVSGQSNPRRTKVDNTPISPYINPYVGIVVNPSPADLEYRGFGLERQYEYTLWAVYTLDDSRLPTQLRGRWTTVDLAKNAIDAYLAIKQKPIVKKETIDDAYDNKDRP